MRLKLLKQKTRGLGNIKPEPKTNNSDYPLIVLVSPGFAQELKPDIS